MPRQNMPQMNIYKQPMMPGGMNGGMGGMGGMSNNNNFQQPQNQYGGMPQQQYRNMPQQPQYGFVPQQNNMGMNNNNFQQGGFQQQQQQQQQPQQNSNTNAGFFWMEFCQQCNSEINYEEQTSWDVWSFIWCIFDSVSCIQV